MPATSPQGGPGRFARAPGCAGAGAATLGATPAWRWVAVRLGVVAPVTDRAVHSRPVPYLGGLAMLSGFLAAFGVAWGFGGFGGGMSGGGGAGGNF